jgi:hypothetical protein
MKTRKHKAAKTEKKILTDEDIRQAVLTKFAVPLWPHAGKSLLKGRSATYEAARRGEIRTIDAGGIKRPVPTSWLKAKLGLDDGGPKAA